MNRSSAPKAGALPDCATPRRPISLSGGPVTEATANCPSGNERRNTAGTDAGTPEIVPDLTPISRAEDGVKVKTGEDLPAGERTMAEGVVDYRAGLDRNEDRALSHTYAMMANDELWPMCGYGWNRSDGSRFSILRQYPGSEGDCKLCRKNVAAGKPPVIDGFPHKTKWL